MANASKRGNYYKIKAANWFKSKGYTVEYLERLQRIYTKGKVIFIKKDILGSDGIAINDSECILWNSILGKANIAVHVKAFKEYPQGGTIKRWLICWTPRISEPEIISIDEIKEVNDEISIE